MTKVIRREAVARNRSRTITLATAEPRLRWDAVHRNNYHEILDMSGFKPNARKRVPLIDGDRSSVKNVLGSIRSLRIDRNRLVGELVFASCPRSRAAEMAFDDEHLQVFDIELLPERIESVMNYRGIEGRTHLVREWGVICAIIKPAFGE